MKLIVGLGNPGRRYAQTRHNVGWRVAEVLARRAGLQAWRTRFDAAVADTRIDGCKVTLARPQTFMNESGRAVRQMVDFWKLGAEDLLVVLDDLAIEVGRIRLRPGGSAGGHNGLASVIEHLGHDRVQRLRVGIGPAPAPEEQVAFVLSRFADEERPGIDDATERAADAATCWAAGGLDEAMNRFNRHPDDEPNQ